MLGKMPHISGFFSNTVDRKNGDMQIFDDF